MSSRAVFLDRDGVLNQAVVVHGRPYPPTSLENMVILPGVPEALADLRRAGFLLIVVTNQPDVARGKTPLSLVEAMNEHLRTSLPLDAVRTCFHDDVQNCGCRKPKPGLLVDAARDFGIDLAASFMVGDRWRDIEAGRQAGCRTVFIDYAYQEKRPEQFDFSAASFPEAASIILQIAKEQ